MRPLSTVAVLLIGAVLIAGAVLDLRDKMLAASPPEPAAVRPHGLQRTFHVVSIAQLAAGKVAHTHVEIEGIVTAAYPEDDGDLHLWICDEQRRGATDKDHCVVGEIIPEMSFMASRETWSCTCTTAGSNGLARSSILGPMPPVKKGDRVIVRGISRYDREGGHAWSEVHPITSLEVQR